MGYILGIYIYIGIIVYNLGLYIGIIGYILGLYWDNGKENGNDHNIGVI